MKIYFKNGLTINISQGEINAINKSIETMGTNFISLKKGNDSSNTISTIRVDEIIYIG